MTEKKELKLAKEYKKALQQGFGKDVCRELHFDCASCKAQIAIGFVNWHIDLLEWGSKKTQKGRKKKLKVKSK